MEVVLVVVGLLVLLVVVPKWNRGTDVGHKTAENINILGKIKSSISLFRNQITQGKESLTHEHGAYYLGYIYGITQEICRQDGIECKDIYLAPVYQEVQRLFGSDSDSIFEIGPKKLAEISASEHGARGLRDGLSDGGYVVKPSNPPPYFEKLQEYFA